MTEEIIIDGVNVAGCCKCYNVEQKILCGPSGICANNPNCYYKQLKRLEQENKELKELNKKICEDWEKEIKVYWNALEEIRILATKNVSIENFVKIQNKINEVLE